MFQLNMENAFDRRVAERLKSEEVIWLVTTDANGAPQPSPVWFLWDGASFLIYSRPNTPKLRNIAANPRVALNFNTNAGGGDVAIFACEARIAPDHAPADAVPAYLEKYRDPIGRINMTPETFTQAYSVALLVTPTKLRGF